jgi:DNA polymerase-3 subunit delta'
LKRDKHDIALTNQTEITDAAYSKILQRLKAGEEKNILPHAFLVSGAGSRVRQEFALDFAEILLSQSELDSHKIRGGNYEDLVYVRRHGAEIVVEQIEQLITALSRKPYYADRIVAIVEDGDRMNATSQNKLLKSLEEPAPGNVIIILAEIPDLLAQTIRSRCCRLVIKASGDVSSPELHNDARAILSEALFTDAPMAVIFEKLDKYSPKKNVTRRKATATDPFAADEDLHEPELNEAELLVDELILFLRDLCVGSRAESLILREDNLGILKRLRPGDEPMLRRCLRRAFDANAALRRNLNKKYCLRNLVLQFRREAVHDKSS